MDKKQKHEYYFGDVNIVSTVDMEPRYILPAEDVLDEMGLKNQRKKMDAAHNMIMQKKAMLAKLETEAEIEEEAAANPFSLKAMEKRALPGVNPSVLSEVINKSALCDKEYRSAADDFLNAVIPAARDRQAELERNCREAKKKHRQAVTAAKRELEDAEAELNRFKKGLLSAVVLKFKLATKCPVDGYNFYFAEKSDIMPGGGFINASAYPLEWIEQLKEFIDDMNEAEAKERDQEYIRQQQRQNDYYNFINSMHVRDNPASVAPIGGVVESGKGAVTQTEDGLKSFLKNIFG